MAAPAAKYPPAPVSCRWPIAAFDFAAGGADVVLAPGLVLEGAGELEPFGVVVAAVVVVNVVLAGALEVVAIGVTDPLEDSFAAVDEEGPAEADALVGAVLLTTTDASELAFCWFAFAMPNCIVYWYWLVPTTFSLMP